VCVEVQQSKGPGGLQTEEVGLNPDNSNEKQEEQGLPPISFRQVNGVS